MGRGVGQLTNPAFCRWPRRGASRIDCEARIETASGEQPPAVHHYRLTCDVGTPVARQQDGDLRNLLRLAQVLYGLFLEDLVAPRRLSHAVEHSVVLRAD